MPKMSKKELKALRSRQLIAAYFKNPEDADKVRDAARSCGLSVSDFLSQCVMRQINSGKLPRVVRKVIWD